jgi:diguanylate cyclase (GGDEF)-like protein/PAS domain S-box-containing protein
MGFAYHRMLYDNNGTPCDYIFLEVNAEFERITGLSGADICGRKVTDVLPGLKHEAFDWIRVYGDIALTGGTTEFEQYFEPLKRWYRVTAYSPEKHHFVTAFVDVSKEKAQLEEMRELAQRSEEFLQMDSSELDYQRLADDLRELSGANYAVFNMYDDEGSSFTTMALSGDGCAVRKAGELLGFKLQGKKWAHDPVRAERTRDQTITSFATLGELVGEVLSRPIVLLIEKTFDVGEVVLVKIMRNEVMLGDFTLIMGRQRPFDRHALIEVHARQVGMLIARLRVEEKLRSSELSLKEAQSMAQIGRWDLEHATNRLRWSDTIFEIFEIDKEEFGASYEAFLGMIHPEDRDMVNRAWEQSLKDKAPYEITHRLLMQDGRVKWVHEAGETVFDDKGHPVSTMGIIQDVTGRKQIEDELRTSRERLANVIEGTNAGTWEWNVQTGETVYNERWAEIVGYKLAEVAPVSVATWEKFAHPEDLVKSFEEIEKVLSGEKEYYELECRMKHRNGEWVWVLDRGKITSRSADGKPLWMSGTHTDITERKQAEEALRENEERLRVIFGNSPVGIFSYDPTGTVTACNESFVSIIGSSRQALIGLSTLKLPDQRIVAAIRQSLAGQQVVFEGEYSSTTAEKVTPVRCTFAPAVDSSGVTVGGIGLVEDVTERIKADQLLRASEERYRTLADDLPGMMCEYLPDATLTYVNKTYADYHGVQPEDLVGVKFLDIIPAENREVARQKYLSLTPQSPVGSLNIQREVRRGKVMWQEWRDRGFFSESGQAVRFQSIGFDITERVEAEEALKASESKFRSFVEKSSNIIFTLDLHGVLTYMSPNIESVLGYQVDSVEGRHFSVFVYEEDVPMCNEYLAEVLRRERLSDSIEFRVWHSDGSLRWLSTTVSVLEQDTLPVFLGVGRDITEKRQMEELVRVEKERFRTTLLSVGDGVIATDNRGNVLLLNQVAERMTGWTQVEAVGKPLPDVFHIIHEFTRELCEDPAAVVLSTGKTIELANHTILVSRDGVEWPIEDSAAPIRDEDGRIHGVVLVFRDVTEKRKERREIEYLSFHDQLTGLYNRRFFEVELKRLDAERNLPLSLVMLDVNGLKLVNDAFGHALGDELLRRVAGVLKQECRADDIIARIGGDEFVIILPKTDNPQTEAVVRRIKEGMDREDMELVNFSVSYGYERKQHKAEDILAVLKKAEDAMYRNKLSESASMRHKTIEVIIKTLYEKNAREESHSKRVSELSTAIGAALALDREVISELRTVGLMHDIGKIAVDDHILDKPASLSDAEWVEIRRHPEVGYRILSSVNEFAPLAEYVLAHHERWDGKGYPKGLSGDEIPIESRIIAIADAFDAMTSARPYRSALSEEVAVAELRKHAGTQFDPFITRIFVDMVLQAKDE